MKKHLIFALLLVIALPAMAQVSATRSKHHGTPHPGTTLTVTAPRGLRFWLYVDDVLQNEDAVRSLCVRNLWDDEFYVRVELDNRQQNCVGQYVNLSRSQSLSVVQSGNLFGLEYSPQFNGRPELTMDLVTNGGGISPMPVMPAPPMTMGMSPRDYENACQIISNESFDSSKLTVAKQVVSSNPMTAAQILGICKMFSFESNKLEFAKFAYPYCIEPNRYYLLNEAFSYESSKRELDEYIKKY